MFGSLFAGIRCRERPRRPNPRTHSNASRQDKSSNAVSRIDNDLDRWSTCQYTRRICRNFRNDGALLLASHVEPCSFSCRLPPLPWLETRNSLSDSWMKYWKNADISVSNYRRRNLTRISSLSIDFPEFAFLLSSNFVNQTDLLIARREIVNWENFSVFLAIFANVADSRRSEFDFWAVKNYNFASWFYLWFAVNFLACTRYSDLNISNTQTTQLYILWGFRKHSRNFSFDFRDFPFRCFSVRARPPHSINLCSKNLWKFQTKKKSQIIAQILRFNKRISASKNVRIIGSKFSRALMLMAWLKCWISINLSTPKTDDCRRNLN